MRLVADQQAARVPLGEELLRPPRNRPLKRVRDAGEAAGEATGAAKKGKVKAGRVPNTPKKSRSREDMQAGFEALAKAAVAKDEGRRRKP